MTLKTALGQPPLVEIFVLDDSPRPTAVREVGLFAKPVEFALCWNGITANGVHPTQPTYVDRYVDAAGTTSPGNTE